MDAPQMMAPLLSTTTSARTPRDAEALPEVRLDVRMGSGRTTGYDISRGEFLVGGGEGCDVRLPGAHFPAVICQVAHTDDGVLLRRLAPAFPMLLNGQTLPGNSVLKLKSGDRIAVGSVDIVVNETHGGHLRPMFTEVRPTKAAPPPTPQPNLDAFRRERADLDTYRNALSEQAKELEADRVAWYRRRQQIEAEVQALQASTMAGGKMADREARLHQRETEVASRERELTRVREELTEIRQTLFEQYRERRDQVEQMQQLVRGANSSLEARQSKTEAELAARAADLQQYVDEEVNRRSELIEAEYRRRRMELDANHDARLRELDDQAQSRRVQFATGLPSINAEHAELIQQRDHLAAAFRELETQRVQLQSMREDFQRERTALEAERRWQEEQRLEREQLHLSRERELDQQETHVQDERQALEEERRKHSDDILRLDRWQATVDERTLQMDRRAAEIDQRTQQLTRDAVELEETMALAEAERQLQTEEAARLTTWKVELESRTGQLSDRSAQLEAQQASLAVLRVKLDRQADELHREAVALTNDRARLDASQRELDVRLQDAEHLRASLGSFHVTNNQAEETLAEQQRLLETTQTELRTQKDRLRELEEQLQTKEADLDRRSADMAEQTAVLKAKMTLAMELHQRLEADRDAVKHRELTLTDVDAARSTFQETLRKRADELTQRDRDLNGSLASLADERLQLDRLRAEFTLERDRQEAQLRESLNHQAQRETELTGQIQLMTEREQALQRQVDRLRESGKMIAAGRKELFEAKQQWQTEQATLVQQTVQTKDELSAFRARALAEMDALRAQAPGLENQAADALQKLATAREILRSQLTELHGYASQSRETLDRLRTDLRSEAERLRGDGCGEGPRHAPHPGERVPRPGGRLASQDR
jgi:chromosome segregation ATPase